MIGTLVLATAFGLVVGALLGLLGGGGSILAVPALVYGVGLPLAEAVPTSLLVVGLSSAAGALPRLKQVQWRLALVFAVTGGVAAFAGTAVNKLLDPSIVLLGFAAVMIAAAVRMLRSGDAVGGSCALPGGGVHWRSCLPKAAAAGVVVGFLTGLFGVGGGFLIIPALTLLLGLPMAAATATSLVVIVANSASALVAHLGDTTIDVSVATAFTAASVVAALAAGRLAPKLSGLKLRRGFAVLVLLVAIYVVLRTAISGTA
ncbi:hypothetical protein FHX74_001672 [Friedmanniella endophytica]|uniref:Probable membrane transporter protein n=1 Tax=Microlunatus kandeliicorticis TaxID=1759536 RepID=A0A7W3P5P0_9ACTN|nr:sulfite exporter TauE/SafE family protein [Microlunatus kandeliicorticis]MBA8794067.1 hypothetical protein [Microlunatus kandeliicorticis]